MSKEKAHHAQDDDKKVGVTSLLSMFSDRDLAQSYMFDSFHLVDLYSTPESDLLRYKKAAFAAMILKQGIYRTFNQWFADRVNLIVDFLKKDYISYADAAFRYMLTVDDSPNLLETIKQSNPKLKEIVMSVAERLRQEGKLAGKLEGKLEIAQSMLKKGYNLEDIMLLTGLSRAQVERLI